MCEEGGQRGGQGDVGLRVGSCACWGAEISSARKLGHLGNFFFFFFGCLEQADQETGKNGQLKSAGRCVKQT